MGKQTTFHCSYKFFLDQYYDKEFSPIKIKRKKMNGNPKKIYMQSRDISEIQD